MRALRLSFVPKYEQLSYQYHSIAQCRRSSTTSPEALLKRELVARKPNVICDYISPTPSHLLNVTLADFLPKSCYPDGFSKDDLRLPFTDIHKVLPQGHHLVYFSPQVPSSDLLPDGTDPLQSPGGPFERRMWAGGSLAFNTELPDRLKLNNQRFCCTEAISDVSIKGSDGHEKIFVNIERQIGISEGSILHPATNSVRQRPNARWPIVETRNLVFMRQKSATSAEEDVSRIGGKVLRRKPKPSQL